jgi:hypothetical protein
VEKGGPATATLKVKGVVQTPTERDKKLAELEEKLKALLKEMQALRAEGETPTTVIEPLTTYYQYRSALLAERDNAAPAEVTLTRATYKLPPAKAEALAKFLSEHVKAVVLETKVEKDNLVVTTTPEAQRVIGRFVALVQGKTATQPSFWKEHRDTKSGK